MSKTRPVWPASAAQAADWPAKPRRDLAPKEASGEPAGRIVSRLVFGIGAHRQHSAHRVPPDLLRRTAHDHRGDDQSVRRHRRRRRLVNRFFRLSHDDEVASFGACGVWPVAGVAHPRCPVLGRAACFVVCFKECNLKMDSWWVSCEVCRSRILYGVRPKVSRSAGAAAHARP